MALITCDRCTLHQAACEFCNYCLDCDFATFEGNSNCPNLECESRDDIHDHEQAHSSKPTPDSDAVIN